MSDGSVLHYDDTKDRERLYNKAVDKLYQRSDSISKRVELRCLLQDIFKKDISINQTKQDLKNLLK